MKKIFCSSLLFIFIPLISYSQTYLPGDNELIMMPTAYTMPAGNSYFSDYEVFFLNYSYAITSSTHLSIFSLFPITTAFYETLTFGIKQNFTFSKTFKTALYGGFIPETSSYAIGDVVSFGLPSKSFHASIAYVKYTENSKADLIYMFGFRFDPSEITSLIIEYENTNTLLSESTFNGLITFGIKLRSSTMSWELGAIRPLSDTGDLIFFPMLKAGYYFN